MNYLFRAKARNYQVFNTPQAKAWGNLCVSFKVRIIAKNLILFQ